VKENRWYDCVVSARAWKEMNSYANSRKEDRIIMAGLTSETPMPISPKKAKLGFN
jgi:hypothetical protein